MFSPHRLIAALAVTGALAVAGPVAGASATTGAVASSTSSVPCYPFPAWCGSNGQPVSWAPFWVRPALGLPPAPLFPPFVLPTIPLPGLPTIALPVTSPVPATS
jgi:hypothetical protein